ncbi:hypothetical protein QBC41DRAFT_143493 [Cercophora samala]|uniref:Uncharacterized protein n=1 Tax=Cercophora samala TaxID=330535 RepID=A0AA39ZL38_9PEZI|nr:hypothetical protein QBC41DRAFT_143493 [Cercophora samala]
MGYLFVPSGFGGCGLSWWSILLSYPYWVGVWCFQGVVSVVVLSPTYLLTALNTRAVFFCVYLLKTQCFIFINVPCPLRSMVFVK